MLRMREKASYPPCASMADKTWWVLTATPSRQDILMGIVAQSDNLPMGLIYFFVGGCGRRSGGDV